MASEMISVLLVNALRELDNEGMCCLARNLLERIDGFNIPQKDIVKGSEMYELRRCLGRRNFEMRRADDSK